ncbi:MAG: hypothetical protein KatS3mg104_1619 [Phycisphaerae bacterium]|nr:MAG: hypothetical protein KatS3mg104_1619 [Phycisphaerae bacterium]
MKQTLLDPPSKVKPPPRQPLVESPHLPLSDAPGRKSCLRGILVGALGVALICGLTPLNDFAFSDTSLSAGFLPVGAVLVMFVLVVAINAPLHWMAPRWALSVHELAIVSLMVMIGSSFPNWGMMKFFIPTLVAPFHIGASDPTYWKVFESLGLPDWLFPVPSIRQGVGDPIVRRFYTAIPEGDSLSLLPWVKPLLVWGIFMVAMVATLIAIARIVVHQWIINERLPFPLVEVQASLIESPRPGHAFNRLFRSPGLWIGLIGVFLVHSLTTANAYQPLIPTIPLGYDFSGIFADPPLASLPTKVKTAKISFMVLGATYFIRSRVAFSVFGIFLLVAFSDVLRSSMGIEPNSAAQADQHLGACVAFILGIFWIGRHHWATVVKNAFGRGKSNQYRLTFWIAVLGLVTMLSWLMVVGVQPGMALLTIAFILGAHLVVSRVVAETGIPFYRSSITVSQIYSNLPIQWFTGRSIFMSNVGMVLGPLTTRDGVMGFATQGLGITQKAGLGQSVSQVRWIGSAVVTAVIIGMPLAAISTLYCHYTYPTPPVGTIVPQGNYFGAEYIPLRDVANPLMDYADGSFSAKVHNPWLNMGLGFAITSILQIGVLRFANWPLLPVGFVTSYGAFVANAWFSIMVGWLAKVLIVRLGGSGLYSRLLPLFIGMILGEALAAGALLLVNAIAVINGYESQTVKFLL